MADRYDCALEGLGFGELILMKVINDNLRIDGDIKAKIDEALTGRIDKMRYSLR